MAYIRFVLDLAIPETVYNSIPSAKKIAFRNMVRNIKTYAVKINEGQPNEEMTVKASWHRCPHDEGLPCEEENEI